VNILSDILYIKNWLLGWPLIFYVVSISIACTIALRFVQIRYFWTALKNLFAPAETAQAGDMTPIQAFVNALSASIGNGAIAGVAAAVYTGGPGAVFWVLIFGIFLMAIRFAEVFLSTYFGKESLTRTVLGGPMLYLKKLPFGNGLAYIYAISCFFFGLMGGNAAQSNSISLSLYATWGISAYITAFMTAGFCLYILLGGAQRIVRVSDNIVPIKVIVFFVSSFAVLAYNYAYILSGLHLIVISALSPSALAGGAFGFTIQEAMRYGMLRSIFATESGLGTAAILFGFTGSDQPVKDGLMSMISTFVSALVCFLVGLCIVVSGAWNSGLDSTALTIASFETLFGQFGGWIVSFLSITFGIGVLVTYAYITRAAWLAVTNGKYLIVFTISYVVATFLGAIMPVQMLWDAIDVVNAIMLIINLAGIAYLLPVIVKGLRAYKQG
jgi:alanine or glycine:cation symporter, AGCS family